MGIKIKLTSFNVHMDNIIRKSEQQTNQILIGHRNVNRVRHFGGRYCRKENLILYQEVMGE